MQCNIKHAYTHDMHAIKMIEFTLIFLAHPTYTCIVYAHMHAYNDNIFTNGMEGDVQYNIVQPPYISSY